MKPKNSLVFIELMSDFPRKYEDMVYEDSFFNEHVFLISSEDPSMDKLLFIFGL